ncbi:MAG: dihydrolipoyllysine-residue succinyltransferase [Candidatus Puniceispirillum sp.]|nr:dihydrolipoyllysine-residue succinyltransferase [Candidatus Pelagibacter sp.]MBA4283299.1 dihydrolipoyllysine-residue succinyltransferase [Candidatus Puniceispirillum sp.]
MSGIEIKVPVLGESIVEATVAKWVRRKGDRVKQDELLLELETDKITLEILAPHDGVLGEILKSEGSLVKINEIVGILETSLHIPVTDISVNPKVLLETLENDKDIIQVQSDIGVEHQNQKQEFLDSTTIDFVSKKALFDFASPAARKKIIDNNLKNVHVSRLDGRISKTDVAEEVSHQEVSVDNPITAIVPVLEPEIDSQNQNVIGEPLEEDVIDEVEADVNERQESRITMSRLRQKISERLKHAQNTAAILTTFNEIDMSQIFSLRSLYKDEFERKHQIKLGFMSFFVKACVKALQEFPIINSRIEGAEIVSSNYIDISVAISAPQGLVVPVLRDADLLEMWEIEKKIFEFSQKAKNNKLSLQEMSGGTFSISNGGVFGSLLSTPIINPPQSAILGMHKIQERAVVVDGKIEVRPMMYLALSYDHRLIDGKEAVTFLATLKKMLENPGYFILGL